MLLFLLGCMFAGEPEKPESYSIDWIEVGYKKTTHSIQESSVRISIVEGEEELGHGSGNYFQYAGEDFIVTAAHVVDTETPMKVSDGDSFVGIRVVYIDFSKDIAILKTDRRLTEIKPKRWNLNKSENLSGIDVYYSGYPSHYGRLLISGMVSSSNDDGVIIQSFALPGSSGSIVFDKHGRVVGVLTAVGLHASPLSPYPSIQEDMVYVSSLSHLNLDTIWEVLKCAK